MKKASLILFILLLVVQGLSANDNPLFKFGLLLNKGDQETYSWLFIHQRDYYIKNMISIGYETQFSYYKVQSPLPEETSKASAYPINIFFNSKIKILRRGVVRPYVGGGFGFLSQVIHFSHEIEFSKSNAYHLILGTNIGRSGDASLQVEFRLVGDDAEGSKTRYFIAAGFYF